MLYFAKEVHKTDWERVYKWFVGGWIFLNITLLVCLVGMCFHVASQACICFTPDTGMYYHDIVKSDFEGALHPSQHG